jgi:superfamily II DNA or RNA helicase
MDGKNLRSEIGNLKEPLAGYREFLHRKAAKFTASGFAVEDGELNAFLFDFQRHIVKTALAKGRYAVFADCGLGKTLIQLEWANQVVRHTKKPVLILAPLAVAGQTIAEGEKFGIPVKKYAGIVGEEIYISNYEQLENIDCSVFAGVVLDESSILKNFMGTYKTMLLELFEETPYKLACTATPSPNDVMELGNHAEFLGVMTSNEMLAMYFVHDGSDTKQWHLKKHGKGDFWSYVASWSVMLAKPQDLGFEAEGYDLPELTFIEKRIETERRDHGMLFNDAAVSATNFNQELRLTKVERLETVAEIVNGSDETFIVWVKQNEEADMIRELVPDAVEVRGNESPEAKEKKLLGFAAGEFRVLLTKTKIAQFGLNFQNCHNQVFASLDFSFEGLYQAIRRSYRFGQSHAVNIYLVTTDTMQNVIDAIERKESQFKEMQEQMIKASGEFQGVVPSYQSVSDAYQSENAWLVKGDCVPLTRELEDESVGFSIFSPPFASLYTYSDKVEDMGNCANYDDFLYSFGLLVEDLFRVMWSGRNVAVHCMDLSIQKGKEGFIGLRDFSGMILKTFQDAGFIYHTRITIWKNPVTEMQRTKALGLLHKQVKKDAAMSRVGTPDYLLVFRKPGDHRHPVRCDIPVELWQKYASPVWYDIDYGRTLNGREGRHEDDERHICPLQLDTIERAIHLWSNEGDTVLTPFLGIGSEAFQAIKMGRKAVGFELKDSYFDVAVRNVQNAERDSEMTTLFDIAGVAA